MQNRDPRSSNEERGVRRNGRSLLWVRVTLIAISLIVALALIIPLLIDTYRENRDVNVEVGEVPAEEELLDEGNPLEEGAGEPSPLKPAE